MHDLCKNWFNYPEPLSTDPHIRVKLAILEEKYKLHLTKAKNDHLIKTNYISCLNY